MALSLDAAQSAPLPHVLPHAGGLSAPAPSVRGVSNAGLSNRDQEILEFERLTWRYPAAKETAVMERFDMTITRYLQRRDWLIDQPAALAYDAQLVNRLRRLRDTRREARTGRRVAG